MTAHYWFGNWQLAYLERYQFWKISNDFRTTFTHIMMSGLACVSRTILNPKLHPTARLHSGRVQVQNWPACSPDLLLTENFRHIIKWKIWQSRPRTHQLESYMRHIRMGENSSQKSSNWFPQFPDVYGLLKGGNMTPPQPFEKCCLQMKDYLLIHFLSLTFDGFCDGFMKFVNHFLQLFFYILHSIPTYFGIWVVFAILTNFT